MLESIEETHIWNKCQHSNFWGHEEIKELLFTKRKATETISRWNRDELRLCNPQPAAFCEYK